MMSSAYSSMIGRIGHDDLHPRRGQIAEGDAEIDHDPLARMRRTVAVKVEVHPDLVRTARAAGTRARRPRIGACR